MGSLLCFAAVFGTGVQMPIPQSVTASSALTQRQAYSGELPMSSFERLREVLVDDAGVLQVELHDEKSRGAKRLQGTVNGELALSCQRCDARIERKSVV